MKFYHKNIKLKHCQIIILSYNKTKYIDPLSPPPSTSVTLTWILHFLDLVPC